MERAEGKAPMSPPHAPLSTLHSPRKKKDCPMKLDVAIMNNTLRDSVALAEAAEAIGFDTLWTSETQHDPFLPLGCGCAAHSAHRLGHGDCRRLRSQPDVDGLPGLGSAGGLRRPFHAGAGNAGPGPHRAALWHAVGRARAQAARVHPGDACDLGRLAERNKAQFPRRVLQADVDGALF